MKLELRGTLKKMGTTIEQKLHTIFVLQDELNELTCRGWKYSENDYARAGVMECAELIDQIGWKWWKKQETNYPEARREVVDILHFIISLAIRWGCSEPHVLQLYNAASADNPKVELLFECKDEVEKKEYIITSIEQLMVDLLQVTSWNDIWFSFFTVAFLLDLDLDDLYIEYIKKNALNKFRQENGYKEGYKIEYRPGIEVKEDNELLEEILNKDLPADPKEAIDYVISELLEATKSGQNS